MKKVLMVSCEGLGRGGVQAVMMSVIREMKQDCLFDMLLFTNQVRYYDDEVLSYGGQIFQIPFYKGSNAILRRLDYFIRGPKIYRNVLRIMRQSGPYDVIHCNNYYESALCVKAASKFGVPVRIAHFHAQMEKQRFPHNVINACYLKMIRKYATHKLACSPSAGESVYGKDADAAAVYNAYDENRFDPGKYPRTEKSLNLIQIGSYSENKNQLFSLEILAALRSQGKDAKLHFVGFGTYRPKVEERTAKLGLAEYVCFHEADADTPELLSRSAACLFPSKQEGFGIVLLEAQAMGVRCYVSDTVPKDADAGGCCFLSLNDGADRWAEKILADYQQHKGMPGDFDCSAFSTENIIENYRRIYRGETL